MWNVTVGEIPTIVTVRSKSIWFEQGELKLCGSTFIHLEYKLKNKRLRPRN